MARVDVTVLGAGIYGLSIAYACALRGARVRVIEKQQIGAGASGGIVGALAPHAPEKWNPLKQFQLESLLAAEDFWADVARKGGRDPLYARSGRWQPLLDAGGLALAQERSAAAQTLWQGRAHWRLIKAPQRPWSPQSPTGFLIEDTLSARIAPRAALAALAAALTALGAEIFEGGAGLPEGKILHATGAAGLDALSLDLGRKVGAGQKGQAVLFAHEARDAPQIFAAGLHIVAHGDGTVAVGSTSESTWADLAPDHQAEALITRARACLPVLAQAPVMERWAGLRPRAASRQPILGPWPGRPGHYIANGGFKIGFGMAPKIAGLMADLILEGQDALPEDFRLGPSMG